MFDLDDWFSHQINRVTIKINTTPATVSAIVFLVTPETRVATAYILTRVEDGEYGVAIAYGSILIVVMLAIIFLFDWLIGEARISRSKAKNQA